MRKRPTDREKLLFKLNNLSDIEIREVLYYIASLETRGPAKSKAELGDDDLTSLLCAAYENRKAQQVFEWEAVRRKAEARGAQQRSSSR
jgi:hypothetical protein